jgi:copper ion binding protein
METTRFTVKGMTCEHCVAAVTQELSALPGVADVEVDLASGHVSVRSEAPVADETVRAAVDEAGYEVVP